MATQAYFDWVNAGRPWRLAKPIAELQAWAERNGVEVLGTIGNEEHLTADRPQDHTPFSATAWPVPLPGYVVTAIDLKNDNGLGQAIEDAARRGEYPWLKYMNHDGIHTDSRDLDGDGITWEEYPSSDQHVHLSIRTDWIDRSIGDFDPLGDSMGYMKVEDVQQALKDGGFDPGPVDGVYGPMTKGAYTAMVKAAATLPTPGPKGDPGEPGKDGRTPVKVTWETTGTVVEYA